MSTTFLKKYKVLGKVGEGSFSEVLKCQNRETGVLYAAKRLKKIKQTITDVLQIPEVVAMRKLKDHPNILHMIESHFDPLPGKVTLIFELMDMSMYDLLKSRRRCLPESRVKNYLYQILKGLDHLHRHGLFHRDIKPENILLKSELVKLADLGSVRGIFCRPPYTEYISTRWYRSPECLLTTGFYGPKMDVWATGCVFYELLTLKPLFPGANEVDQLQKIHLILGTPTQRLITKFRRHKSRNCEYFFPTRTGCGICPMLPNVSENGRDILQHMLIYDPETRSNVRRLLEHRYFNDLREEEMYSPRRRSLSLSSSSNQSGSEWRNPALLSYMTTLEKRRKPKQHSNSKRTSVESKAPTRVVVSSPSKQQSPTKYRHHKHRSPNTNKELLSRQKMMERTWGVSSLNKKTPVYKTSKLKAIPDHEEHHLPRLNVPKAASKETFNTSSGTSTLPALELPGSNKTVTSSSVLLAKLPPPSFLRLPPLVQKGGSSSSSEKSTFSSDLLRNQTPRYFNTGGKKLATIEEQPGTTVSKLPSIQNSIRIKSMVQGKILGRSIFK